MPRNAANVLLGAVLCLLLGLIFFRMQQGTPNQIMNAWGVVSFTSLGACLGCLASMPADGYRGRW